VMNAADLYLALSAQPSDQPVYVEVSGKWLKLVHADESLSHRILGVQGPVFVLHALPETADFDLCVYKHSRGWAIARRGTQRARAVFTGASAKQKALTRARRIATLHYRQNGVHPRIFVHRSDGLVEAVIAQ